jgi:hypothetical protein
VSGGDLTEAEIHSIQAVVDEAGRPLWVVGSAARGTRYGLDLDAPVAKGIKSDIDYLVPYGSAPYYRGLETKLPSLDPKQGMIPGYLDQFLGPAIRFEPWAYPYYIPSVVR